jgi:hypothetical protein
MARSQDAMRKRADKRNRTLPEQRKADSADMRKRLEEEAAVKKQRMIQHANASMQIDTTPVGHYGPTKTTSSKAEEIQPNLKHPEKAEKAASSVVAPAAAAAPMVKTEKKAAPMDKKEETITNKTTDTETRTDTDAETRTYKRTNGTVHKYGSKKIDPLSEQGSWKCPGCQNHNFASRSTCNSKTCNETRPADCLRPIQRHLQASQQHLIPSLQRQRPVAEPAAAAAASDNSNGKRPAPAQREREPNSNSKRPFNNRDKRGRHDVNTSKTQSWAVQSDDATLAQNRELRRKLAESPGGTGEGMDEEDVKRAKTLIARDERKKQKKQEKQDQKEERKQKQLRK